MYHAIIINKQFEDESFPNKYKSFAEKLDGSWEIYGIEIEDIDSFISEIQENMKEGKWYAHAYDNRDLIVIFKDKIFKTGKDKSSWADILEYGIELSIPEEQLDFQPNNFDKEKEYFN